MSQRKKVSIQDRDPLNNLFATTGTADNGKDNGKDVAASSRGETRQSTILLYDDQLAWLDEKCLEARRGGKSIRKAVIIRSLIDLAIKANAQMTGIQSEDEIISRLESAIAER